MSLYAMALRRRLLRKAASALADFSLIVDGAEYKPGDTVTILESTTVTVKGSGTAKVTLIGGGGGGGSYVGDLSENYNEGGTGGNGGTSIFTQELTTGTYDIVIGKGGAAVIYGSGGSGGTTSAFGHSAGGGGGGVYSDDFGDGADGDSGSGETSYGNTTQYGRGGAGSSGAVGWDGTSGACIIKLIDPNAKTRTITLSGTFSISFSYVTINGEKITAAGTYEALDGDVITLALMAPSSFGTGGKVTVDGVTVITATRTLQTYDHTITSDCTITGSTSGSSYMLKYEIALVTT